ncbi:MAG: hypothetical protein ROZ37_10240 [Aromatoleum sp.]|jgi:hypothetical protein|uniref:hypothetical protein n=1 Tax=Aromatoleum sp. TaxID=2307007 RepID=UPI002894F342|nr:hypothetical protein [Aromatoleum sp.]MDT3670701.1 hypothetical protein [Aromatoleum sp.]
MRIGAGVVALLCVNATAGAATLRVGPFEQFTQIADAAKRAKDGDTVEILPGEYRGDVAVWNQKQLTIRGVGERPVLIAEGASAEGKAIWVIRNGDFRIQNVEFRGARVPDGNGAGIRLERGRLHVSGSAFVDNQNGILTGNDSDTELRIDDSLFAEAPRNAPLPHLLYAGRIARLEVSGSRFHRGYEGHLIKSRARYNDIRYNLIHDGPGGEASYEIDFPNGGVAFVVGNVIGQSAATQNPVVVAYGAEGRVWPDSGLYLSHNTLLNERMTGAWFLRVWKDKLPAGTEIKAVNNLTVGLGVFTLAAPGEFSGNVPAIAAFLGGPDILDFTLGPNSILRRLGTDPGQARGYSLAPAAEFALPIGTHALEAPLRWAPGAFQTSGYAP